MNDLDEKQTIYGNLEERIASRVIKGIVTTVLVAFAVITLGAAALPAILAHLFGWQWWIAYPCAFAVCVLWARVKKR